MLLILLACQSPSVETVDAAEPRVAQVGRYAAGIGHIAARAWADTDEGSVTVETRGSDGIWEEAENVSVDWDGAPALDVVLVADNSGSVVDFDALIAETVGGFGAELLANDDNRAGLVRVSTEAQTLAALSDDEAAWAEGVAELGVKNGWTALWDGIRLAHEVHAEAQQVRASATLDACVGEAHRAVVVYTDGQENNSADQHETSYDGDGVDTTVDMLLSQSVAGIQPPIYSIGVGDGVDVDALSGLATGTGGSYLAIDDLSGLSDALGIATASLDTEIPVCWETPDCTDTEVRVTLEQDGETWTETFALPSDLCVTEEEVGCTLTQGYWKNHPEDWPVATLTLGGRSYDADALLSLLETPTRGNRSLQIAHQLIAARLNEANGADTSAIDSTLAEADAWLAAYDDGDGLPLSSRYWSDCGDDGEDLGGELSEYNEGSVGPGHCD